MDKGSNLMFKKLDGDTAIISTGGVFKTCDLYEMDGRLFAQTSGGFIRLNSNGTASKDRVQVISLAIDSELFQDRFGRLCVSAVPGAVRLEQSRVQLLLGGSDK